MVRICLWCHLFVVFFSRRRRHTRGALGMEFMRVLFRSPAKRFEGDGRTHCSQMRSCAEARWFLRNAPTQRWMGIETANLVSGSGAIDRSEVWQLMQARITSKQTSESQ